MLPLMIDVKDTPIAIVGSDHAALMRVSLIDQSGAGNADIFAEDPSDELRAIAGSRLIGRRPESKDFEKAGYRIVYIGDMSESEARNIVDLAHSFGALVNVHDIKALCDFHVPARLVRGDLQITVSTNGRAAGLSRILRDHLANRVFGPDWAAKVSSLGAARDEWCSSGASFDDLVHRTEKFVTDRGWLSRKTARQTPGREG